MSLNHSPQIYTRVPVFNDGYISQKNSSVYQFVLVIRLHDGIAKYLLQIYYPYLYKTHKNSSHRIIKIAEQNILNEEFLGRIGLNGTDALTRFLNYFSIKHEISAQDITRQIVYMDQIY